MVNGFLIETEILKFINKGHLTPKRMLYIIMYKL